MHVRGQDQVSSLGPWQIESKSLSVCARTGRDSKPSLRPGSEGRTPSCTPHAAARHTSEQGLPGAARARAPTATAKDTPILTVRSSVLRKVTGHRQGVEAIRWGRGQFELGPDTCRICGCVGKCLRLRGCQRPRPHTEPVSNARGCLRT